MNLYRYPQFTDTIIDYLPIIWILPQPSQAVQGFASRPVPPLLTVDTVSLYCRPICNTGSRHYLFGLQ